MTDVRERGSEAATAAPSADRLRSARSRGVPRPLDAALVAIGVGSMFVVVHDGTPVWQTVRTVVVVALFSIVLWVLHRVDGVPRALLTFAVGTVAVAVGIGFGLPHLAKTGLSTATVAGLLILVGGFVLVVSGMAMLLRATGGWRRATSALGLVIVFLIALSVLGQAVAATNVPRTAVGSATPADRALSFRDATFRTRDGVALSGWYIPSRNGAAIALLHGAGSTRSNVLEHAVVLARHGYGVLLYDARGHGRSGGRAMDFGWYGDQDVRAAVSYLQRAADVDDRRIAVVGLSMGGEEAIGASATDPRIKAVVAEGATNRVPEDKAWLSDEFGWRGTVQHGIEWLVYNTADLLTSAEQPIALPDAVAKAAPRPVLLIEAAEVPDEARAGHFIQAGSPDTVQIWVARNAGHTDALDVHPHEWERRVTKFLEDALAAER
jgi:pimeloyl-ACP methyl ester carboxylesterase